MKPQNIFLNAFIILFLFFAAPALAHLCHDPFRPRDHLILIPEKTLIRMERVGEFRIYMENAFRVPLRGVRLFVENPAFDIKIEPSIIEKLVPGEKTFFSIKLELREGFELGEHPLRVSVEARGAELRPGIEEVAVAVEEVPIPLPPERGELHVEEMGEIVVRVEEFILAKRWYLHLIFIVLLLGFLIWNKRRQR